MEKIEKHKLLFQSVAIFLSWLLIADTCILFIPSFIVFYVSGTVIGISVILTTILLFILALVTIRGKQWSYLGWTSLTFALIVLMVTIPGGLELIYITLLAGLVSLSSYFGFGYKKINSAFTYSVGVFMLIVFVSHAFIISKPRMFGADIKGDELQNFYSGMINKVAEMPPSEFIKTKEGRNAAIQVYNLPPLTTQEELNTAIKTNPQPLIEAQQLFVSTEKTTEINPYGYILSVYLYPIIKIIKTKI